MKRFYLAGASLLLMLGRPTFAQLPSGPPVDLTPDLVTEDQAARPSADGKKIAWASLAGDHDGSGSGWNVMVQNIDGTGRQRVRFQFVENPEAPTDLSDAFQDDAPALSPDGSKVVFQARTRDGSETDLVMVDLATGTATRLTTDTGQDAYPTWSADGTKIAFLSDRFPASGLQAFVMKAAPEGATNTPVQLTNWGDGTAARPFGAPDGSLLVAKYYGPSRSEIYRVDLKDSNGDGEGDNLTALTDLNAPISDPSQAVAGGRIFFLAPTNDYRPHVYSMKADGTDVRQTTGGEVWETSPTAAGGRLFVSQENAPLIGAGNQDIFAYPLADDAPGTLSGTLTTSAGKPQAGATVNVTNGQTAVTSATTDASGKYSLTLPAGGYTLQFMTSDPASETVLTSVTVPAGGSVTKDVATSPLSAPVPVNVIPTIKYPAGGSGQVSVRWSAGADPAAGFTLSGFNVYRSASASGPWTKIGTTGAVGPYEVVDSAPGNLASAYYTVTALTTDGANTAESAFAAPGQAANNLVFNPSFELTASDTTPLGWHEEGWYGADGAWGTSDTEHVDGARAAYIEHGSNTGWGMGLLMTDSMRHPAVTSASGYVEGLYTRFRNNPSTTKTYLQPAYLIGSRTGYLNFYPWQFYNTSDYLGGGASEPDKGWNLMANTNNLRPYEFANFTRLTVIWENDGTSIQNESRAYFDEVRYQVKRIGATGIISGRVQQKDGAGLSCAITVAGKTTWTDPYAGTFIISGVPTGDVELTLSNTGSADRKITVPNYGGYVFSPDITYTDASGLPLGLTGTVLLPNGRPAEGARVLVQNASFADKEALTDANGHYAVADVGSTTATTITVTKDGYGKAQASGTLGLYGMAVRDFVLPAPPPQIEIARAATAPTIDGVVNAAEWAKSQPITLWYREDSTSGPTVNTTAYALWDANNLYLAFVAQEPNPAGIEARATGHDNSMIWTYDGATFNADDNIGVYLDAKMADPPGLGSEVWQIVTNTNQSDPSWADIAWYGASEGWNLAADITGFAFKAKVDTAGKQWTTEMKIPFAGMDLTSFGGMTAPSVSTGTKWRINLQRARHQTAPNGEVDQTTYALATFVDTVSAFPKGDLNGDRQVDGLDVSAAVRIISGQEALGARLPQGDINGDGKVNWIDTLRISRKVAGLDTF